MLSSSVWRERSRWWFSGGLVAGGFTAALVTVTVGSLLLRPFLPRIVEVVAVAVVFTLVAANEFGLVRIRLPQNARQVPSSIVDDGHRYGALQFGFEMGTGVRTYMTSGLPHALASGLLLLANLPDALLAGAAFGLGRAAMTLARHAHPDRDAWDDALRERDRVLRSGLTVAFGLAIAVAITHV
jgi:hypothetical protein